MPIASIEEVYLLVAERRPTPRPAKNRPATNSGILVAAVWRITPNEKTTVLRIMARRRPKKSAIGAAKRAPKKVPAESRETIMEDWEEVTSGRPSLGLTNPVENISRHFFMARIPLIVPVS